MLLKMASSRAASRAKTTIRRANWPGRVSWSRTRSSPTAKGVMYDLLTNPLHFAPIMTHGSDRSHSKAKRKNARMVHTTDAPMMHHTMV